MGQGSLKENFLSNIPRSESRNLRTEWKNPRIKAIQDQRKGKIPIFRDISLKLRGFFFTGIFPIIPRIYCNKWIDGSEYFLINLSRHESENSAGSCTYVSNSWSKYSLLIFLSLSLTLFFSPTHPFLIYSISSFPLPSPLDALLMFSLVWWPSSSSDQTEEKILFLIKRDFSLILELFDPPLWSS